MAWNRVFGRCTLQRNSTADNVVVQPGQMGGSRTSQLPAINSDAWVLGGLLRFCKNQIVGRNLRIVAHWCLDMGGGGLDLLLQWDHWDRWAHIWNLPGYCIYFLQVLVLSSNIIWSIAGFDDKKSVKESCCWSNCSPNYVYMLRHSQEPWNLFVCQKVLMLRTETFNYWCSWFLEVWNKFVEA